MKKKLTVGMLLALVVVLVASVVVEGKADAAKPQRQVNVDLILTPLGDECALSANFSFQDFNAWGYEIWWRYFGNSSYQTIESTKHSFGGRTTSAGPVILMPAPGNINQPCDRQYQVLIKLLRKNGRAIRGALTYNVRTCGCPP